MRVTIQSTVRALDSGRLSERSIAGAPRTATRSSRHTAAISAPSASTLPSWPGLRTTFEGATCCGA